MSRSKFSSILEWCKNHKWHLAVPIILVAVGLVVALVPSYGGSNTPAAQQPAAQSLIPAEGNYLVDGSAATTLPSSDQQTIEVPGIGDADLTARATNARVDVGFENTWSEMPSGSLNVSGPNFASVVNWNPMDYAIQPTFSGQVAQAGLVTATVTIRKTRYPDVQVGTTGAGTTGKTYTGQDALNVLNFSVNPEACQAVATVSANSSTTVSLTSGIAMLSKTTAGDGKPFPMIGNLQNDDKELSLGIDGPNGQVLSLVIPLDLRQLTHCPTQRRAP